MSPDKKYSIKTPIHRLSFSKIFLSLTIILVNVLTSKSDQTAIFGGAFGEVSDIGYADKTGNVLNMITGAWTSDYLISLQTRMAYKDPVTNTYGDYFNGYFGSTRTGTASGTYTNAFEILTNEHINTVQLYMGVKSEGWVVNGVRFFTNTNRISGVFGKGEGCNFLIFLHGRLISFAGRSNFNGIVALKFNYFPYTDSFPVPTCDALCSRYCGNYLTQCASIIQGYFMLKTTTGETQCDSNTSLYIYESRESKIYQRCQPQCLTCSITSTTCITCSPAYYPLEDRPSNCIVAATSTYQDAAADKYYIKDVTNFIYKLCDNSCLQCTEFAKKCLNCRSGFIRRENDSFSCLADAKTYFDSSINKNYYRDSSGTSPIFRECKAPCVACEDSATKCVGSCDSTLNFYRLEGQATCVETTAANDSGTTVRQYYDSTAKQGYYLDTSVIPQLLRKCHSSCEKCFGKGDAQNNNCQTCAQGFNKVFYNQKNCFNGSELFHYFDSNDKFYKKCYDTCKTCSAGGTDVNNNCKTCKDGLVQDPISIGMCRGSLDNINKDGYFLNSQTGFYEKCGESCKSCDKGASTLEQNCKTCKDGTYLKNPAKDQSGNCFQGNLEGFYLNKNASYYDNCYTNCKTCDAYGDLKNHNCLECADNYIKLNDNPKMCFSFLKPPKGYFYDETAKILAKCPTIVSANAATSSSISGQTLRILTVIPNRFDTKTKRNLEIRFSDSIVDDSGSLLIKEVFMRTNNSPKYKLTILAGYCNYISVNFDPAEALRTATFRMRMLEESQSQINFDSKLIKKYYKSIKRFFNQTTSELNLIQTNSSNFNKLTDNNASYNSQIRILQSSQTINPTNSTGNQAISSPIQFKEGEYEIIAVDKFNNEISSKLNNIAINLAQTKIDTILTDNNSQLISSMKTFLEENKNFDPIVLRNPDNTVVAIYNLSDTSISKEKDISVQNGISYFEFSDCLQILMSFYNYTQMSDLVAIKVDQTGSTSQSSESGYKTGFTVIDRQGKKLDLSPCDKTTVKSMIPIKTGSPINLTLAAEFEKNANASIYDPNAAFYTDLCFSYADNETDLSLNNRRKSIYPNVTIQCSAGCNFTSLDTSIGYSQCSCQGSALEELSVQYINNALDVLINNNLKLIVCVEKVFEPNKLSGNYAFFFTIVLVSIIVLEMLIFCIYPCINQKTIKGIIESDGSYLDYLRVQEINKKLVEEENDNLNNTKKKDKENEINKKNIELITENNKNEIIEPIKSLNSKNEEENVNEKTNLNAKKNKSIQLSLESYDFREKDENENNIEILNKETNAVLMNNHIVKDSSVVDNKDDVNSYKNNQSLNSKNSKFLNDSKLKENMKKLKTFFSKKLVLLDKDGKEKQRKVIDVITKENIKVDIPEDIDASKFLERDYEEMSFEELKKYDKRSFARKVFIQIKQDNPLASLIFKRSLIYPLHLAIFCFLFDFYIDCGANAIFYSDEYISHNYENKDKSSVELFFWGLPKSLYAGLFCVLVGSIIRLFIKPPTITKKEISITCINENIAEIKFSYSRFMKIMKKRYIVYFTISTIFIIFFGIFMICFCGTYRMSQSKWMIGSVTTLVYRLAIIKIIFPLIKVSVLALALKKDSKAPCICFDVDGVLRKGKQVLPGAKESLERLKHKNIPIGIVTNGGGEREDKRAKVISEVLGLSQKYHLDEREVFMCHTPMKGLRELYQDKLILVSGVGEIEEVMLHYGFKNFMTTEEYCVHFPELLSPFFHEKDQEKVETIKRTVSGRLGYKIEDFPQIHAILMATDLKKWEINMQTFIDLLISKDGKPGSIRAPNDKQFVDFHLSSEDLLYKDEFNTPRIAAGSFWYSLQHLYERIHNQKIHYTLYGKPSTKMFLYAKQKLDEKYSDYEITNHYMIGDNPTVDIQGANDSGFISILVRTGVFSGKDNHDKYPAKYVVDNVGQAVKLIEDLEKI